MAMQKHDESITKNEIRMARLRLIAAEKSSIQRSANQGLISMHVAESLLAEADRKLDEQLDAKAPSDGTEG